jgi:hypothetical protein
MPSVGERIRHHLEVLVEDIGARPPGSPANRRATDHVHASLTAAGRPVTALPFTTRWWEPGTGWLEVNGAGFEVDPNTHASATPCTTWRRRPSSPAPSTPGRV